MIDKFQNVYLRKRTKFILLKDAYLKKTHFSDLFIIIVFIQNVRDDSKLNEL